MSAITKSFAFSSFATVVLCGTMAVGAQGPVPRTSGTVKAATATSLTVTAAPGQDVMVTVTSDAKVLQVAPGSKDLSAAAPIALSGIVAGDKVLITGTAGDAPGALHATRVIVMKSAAIAETHAAEAAAWRDGSGGVVKTVNAGAGVIMMSSGLKMLTVQTSAATKFRHYSGDSVRFEDAVTSQLADIKPGDQLRVRGAKSADGNTITAEEIVAGTFRHFSGLLTAIDATAGTVTLKDLASKKTVTVKVSGNSDVRRLPPAMAARFAAKPGAAAAGAGAGGARAGAGAGADLSQMLSRLPTESLGGLKVGDAVMIVATQAAADSTQATAVTLLTGVEVILQGSPEGEMQLTPWSVGGGGPDTGGA